MPNQNPLVSVIIPTYKQHQYLPTAILSVVAQTYSKVELIIVSVQNDGETSYLLRDDLQLACKSLRLVHSLKLIQSEVADHIQQINLGLEQAHGEFVTIAASDDFMLPNKIQREKEVQEIANAVLVYSRFFQADENLNITVAPPIPEFSYERLTYRNFVTDCSFVAKSMFDEFGLFDESLSSLAVYDKWLHIAEKYENRVVLNSSPTFIYRMHSQQKHTSRIADPKQMDLYNQIVNASLKRKGINKTVRFGLVQVPCERA